MAVAHPTAALTRTLPARRQNDNIIRYEVVHWINGRIRLHIPRLATDKKFAQRLTEALMTLPALKQARMNADRHLSS